VNRPGPEEADTADTAPDAPDEDRLVLAPGVAVPLSELSWRFSTSSGAGGQHVNTANTRAEVTLDIAAARGLPEWARDRLIARIGPVVSVAASARRSQLRNRQQALTRLAAKLSRALADTPPRRPTRPTQASQRRRLDQKRRHSELKRNRRTPPED
jgi:ribosome-associated protein